MEGVSVQGSVKGRVSVQGSLSGGIRFLSMGFLSCGSLCIKGGLCPGKGVPVKGRESLHWRQCLSRGGVSIHGRGSMSRRGSLSTWSLCPGASISGVSDQGGGLCLGISVQRVSPGFSVWGVSVQRE